jgi:hypothetical protein
MLFRGWVKTAETAGTAGGWVRRRWWFFWSWRDVFIVHSRWWSGYFRIVQEYDYCAQSSADSISDWMLVRKYRVSRSHTESLRDTGTVNHGGSLWRRTSILWECQDQRLWNTTCKFYLNSTVPSALPSGYDPDTIKGLDFNLGWFCSIIIDNVLTMLIQCTTLRLTVDHWLWRLISIRFQLDPALSIFKQKTKEYKRRFKMLVHYAAETVAVAETAFRVSNSTWLILAHQIMASCSFVVYKVFCIRIRFK